MTVGKTLATPVIRPWNDQSRTLRPGECGLHSEKVLKPSLEKPGMKAGWTLWTRFFPHWGLIALALWGLVVWDASVSLAQAATDIVFLEYKITDTRDQVLMSIQRPSPTRWIGKLGSREYALELFEVNTFKLPDGATLRIDRREDKIKLKSGDNSLQEIKVSHNKFKITFGQAEAEKLEIEYKTDKLKVEWNDKEIGQIKFYSDTGKTKAKDKFGTEKAVLKGLGRNTAALAPFLMTPAPAEPQLVFLVLYFLANGQ